MTSQERFDTCRSVGTKPQWAPHPHEFRIFVYMVPYSDKKISLRRMDRLQPAAHQRPSESWVCMGDGDRLLFEDWHSH
ncbi:hypothetical protein EVAR_94624_1 [Eumeta japonica]|uniref:Uncharacterized protein n=1 Tax=Eumeta variegata TaxID=151549 RepID=A0A4C1UVG8_EUMVA|nr:hypothetical protein EVAR_94624_1 [Eumeta japonica]